MITKTFFLAKIFYRYRMRMFRDHENPAAGYPPAGCICTVMAQDSPRTYRPIRTRYTAIRVRPPALQTLLLRK